LPEGCFSTYRPIFNKYGIILLGNWLVVSYWTGRSIALRVKQLTETVPDILARIVAHKRRELASFSDTYAEMSPSPRHV